MPSAAPPPAGHAPPAALWRRLAAMGYDVMLLTAVLAVAAVPVLVLRGGAIVPTDAVHPAFHAYLYGVCMVFVCWFWTHGGQTLGMRAWRIRLRRGDGGPVGWRQAGARFVAASFWILPWALFHQTLGLDLRASAITGFVLLLITLGLRWHDRLCGTELVMAGR